MSTGNLTDATITTATGDQGPGYRFWFSGGNGSTILLAFEIPQLKSGSYSYQAFSSAWPRSLAEDEWENYDRTIMEPVSSVIDITITRYSSNSADGTFSVTLTDGSSYVTATKGIFSNIPVGH